MSLAVQRSFEDLGTALIDQAFVVFDFETTGASAAVCRITEIGAVKVRGGEVIGEMQSLVNPLVPIPPGISYLTGITNEMVASAPPIESLLPALIEFIGDAVLVAHNASFDVGFLRATCRRLGYGEPRNPVVCTVRLARRLVRDEVPNLQLSTLAHAMRAHTKPTHRALDDARATTDVFHAFLELAARWGISHTDDLLWFQSTKGHPSYKKVRLVEHLPRARGVYLFRGDDGRVLYVGKATDLRARVRSYFGDGRRHMGDLLRELARVDHISCTTDLDASVLEARLIRAHAPRFNRAQRGTRAQWFLRLTDERFPRIASTKNGGPGTIGPFPSAASARVREALEEATDVRTCTMRITKTTSRAPCVRGQIDRCPAPCADPNVAGYENVTDELRRVLRGDATGALDTLHQRIERLAAHDLFEQAAATRDRLGALVDAVRTARAVGALRRAGRARLSIGEDTIALEDGFIASVNGAPPAAASDGHADEPRLIAAWLARNIRRVRIQSCEGELAHEIAGGAELATWHRRLRALRLERSRATAPERRGSVATRTRGAT
ncbi:MAG TPA: DEDD exonuclease domain-containing protein [Actinomycetota bacterium]|nr:DEDD exonuclease domain-containing protein [Actinomycetota bacterium]